MLRSLWIKIPTVVGAVAAAWWLDGVAAVVVPVLIGLAGTAALLRFVLHPNASVWTKTVWRAPGDSDAVALTFDDGPDPSLTPEILRVLDEHGVRAAFFVVGEAAREHPEYLARIHEAGHLVCNHTDTHGMDFHFRLWGPIRRELRACNDAIAAVIRKQPTFFRAPQGHKNPALCDVLNQMDMTAVGWQVRGLDSITADARIVADRILRGVEPGGVIQLHDGSGYGGRAQRRATVEALPAIIDGVRERGLRFARLDELVGQEPYRPVAA